MELSTPEEIAEMMREATEVIANPSSTPREKALATNLLAILRSRAELLARLAKLPKHSAAMSTTEEAVAFARKVLAGEDIPAEWVIPISQALIDVRAELLQREAELDRLRSDLDAAH